MTAIFHSTNVDRDFADFQVALFATNSFKHSVSPTVKPGLKKYHRLTYVLALLESKLELKFPDEHKFLYTKEIVSDLLTNASISFLGFYYASQILIRRLIENFYNHIYYFEHPVEFELLNLGRNEYNPIVELKNYYESHPIIKQLSDGNLKSFNTAIFDHYQILCKTVHTKGENFMGLAKNLDEIKPNFDVLNHLDLINKTLQNIIYLLFKFHYDLEYTNIEKDLIAKSFPVNIRRQLLST